jgi:hypothetical protein
MLKTNIYYRDIFAVICHRQEYSFLLIKFINTAHFILVNEEIIDYVHEISLLVHWKCRETLLTDESILVKPVRIHLFSKSGVSSSAMKVTWVAQSFIGMLKLQI